MRRHHGRHCGCQPTVVHPTKHNCVNTCSENTVNHIHPSHTTVMNHHTVKNKHFYPHSTSFQNTTNSVNEYGGSFNVPNQVGGAMWPNQGGQVGGAMSPNQGGQVGGAMSPHHGHGSQVGGAMSPHHGHGSQVGGAMQPGYGHHNWKKPNKWC